MLYREFSVFDFDGTIYEGDSSIDFWLFCIRGKYTLIRFFPNQIMGLILYKLKLISKEEFKSRFFSFVRGIKNIDSCVSNFWDKNERKIKNWYKDIKEEGDCIISASPEFLLSEISKRLGITNLIATRVDKKTGKLLDKNCYRENKPIFFREKFGDIKVKNFYTDSVSDFPMSELAERVFYVEGENVIKII